jgi:hypothetical protein
MERQAYPTDLTNDAYEAVVGWSKHFRRFVLEAVRKPAAQKGFVLLARRWVVKRTFAWLDGEPAAVARIRAADREQRRDGPTGDDSSDAQVNQTYIITSSHSFFEDQEALSMRLRKIASFLLLALNVVLPKGAESKPFRKVLILSGGELRFSAGLAMLATLYQRGWIPDVTIYTCGFSMVPGAYLNSLTQLQPGQPDPAKWYEAALSDEYFRIMQRVKVNKDFFSRVVDKDGNTASMMLYGQMTSRIAGMQLKKGVNKASESPLLSTLLRTNPNPFRMTPVAIYPALYRDNEDTLLDVPVDLSPPGMNIPFSANKMRAVIVATKILYPRELQGKRRPEHSGPLYQEVVFTDRLTADEIARVKYEKSPIAKMFPKAPIHTDVEVRSGYRVWDVARAALADMYLTEPMWLEDPTGDHPKELFITGALNISPIELALSLGDEVMAIRMKKLRASNPVERIESNVYEDTFGFTNDERRLEIQNRFGDQVIWIDLEGVQEMEKRTGFSPLRIGDGPRLRLEDNIPNDPAEFKRRSKAQWEWGVDQIRRVDLRRKGGQ